MHNLDLILTLTAGFATALLFGVVAHRMRLPAIVGYLIGGLLIGPYTPGFTANHEIAQQLAEVGVILLMFGVGLHFHLKDLLAVRRVAVTGALVEIVTVTAFGVLAGRAFGWSYPAAIVFGISLSVASTVVLTRVLAENHALHTQTGQVAVGWLVVEDIFTVLVLVMLPAIFASSEGQMSIPASLGMAIAKLAVMVALTLAAGGKLIPWMLAKVALTNSRELFTLTVLVIALGVAVGSATLFGVSMALGAFLAGMVVGQSEFSYRAASEALPMQEAFAVLFFVSIGMLFNPLHLVQAPFQILATTLIVLLVKPLSALTIVLVLGYGARLGLGVAAALSQIGEFSFIVATLGEKLKILPEGATDSLIAASIISITLNPLIYRFVPPLEKSLMRTSRRRSAFSPRVLMPAKPQPAPDASSVTAVIVGYGPVGRTVCRLLNDQGIVPTVIELNIETVRDLNSRGTRAVYGDASQKDILLEAGVRSAGVLILSSPASEESMDLIRTARALNGELRVLVRCKFLSQAVGMRQAGAQGIFSGEAEVAMAMTEYILRERGVAPDRLEGERDRLRHELYGIPL